MANPQRSFRPPFLLLFVVCVLRIALHLAHGGRLGDVGFAYLYFVFHYLMLHCLLSPRGSAAHRWARFGVLVFFSAILLDLAWIEVGPPAPTPEVAVFWGISVLGILFLLYGFIKF